VLADLGGTTVLAFMVRRLLPLRDHTVDELVVATSEDNRDDPVAEIAAQEGVACVRGSENDVLGRFGAALDAHPADHVVRLTADCPLSDPELVTRAVSIAVEGGADYASNTLIRTFPDGLDVEVVKADALRRAVAEAEDVDEREHVTPFVYRQPGRFQLAAVIGDELLGDERWTLDTAADLDQLRSIVERLNDPIGARWHDILTVAGRQRAPSRGEPHLVPDVSFPLSRGRAWYLVQDDAERGRMVVEIRDRGEGRLDLRELPEGQHALGRQLLDTVLGHDLQVRRLQDVP
jgi:spore coat polysaccharide biosynthesis protein SpsF